MPTVEEQLQKKRPFKKRAFRSYLSLNETLDETLDKTSSGPVISDHHSELQPLSVRPLSGQHNDVRPLNVQVIKTPEKPEPFRLEPSALVLSLLDENKENGTTKIRFYNPTSQAHCAVLHPPLPPVQAWILNLSGLRLQPVKISKDGLLSIPVKPSALISVELVFANTPISANMACLGKCVE